MTDNLPGSQLPVNQAGDEFLWHVHQYYCEHIQLGDRKAAGVILWTSCLIAFLVPAKAHLYVLHLLQTLLQIDLVSSAPPTEKTAHYVLAVVTFCSLSIAFLLAVWAIRPNLWDKALPGFIFWNRVKAHKTAHQFYWEWMQQSPDERTRHLSEHVFTLAGVCQRKFRLVALGFPFAILGTVAGAALAGLLTF